MNLHLNNIHNSFTKLLFGEVYAIMRILRWNVKYGMNLLHTYEASFFWLSFIPNSTLLVVFGVLHIVLVKKHEAAHGVRQVMNSRFRVKNLSLFPCPKMTLQGIKVPSLRVRHVLPIVRLVFLGTKSKDFHCLLQSQRRKQAISKLSTVEFASQSSRTGLLHRPLRIPSRGCWAISFQIWSASSVCSPISYTSLWSCTTRTEQHGGPASHPAPNNVHGC